MKKQFDLTTSDGLEAAAAVLDSDWGWVLFPGAKLAKAVYDYIQSPSDISPEEQAGAAERIVEAGRKNNARRVRFKVSKTVGLKLKGNIKGADVSTTVGSDGKMEVEVEYK